MSKLTYGEMRTRAQKIEDEAIKDRVIAGLAVLQEAHGDNWVEKIDCKTLDLSHYARCVLGQVYGDFEVGVKELTGGDYSSGWAVAHGFESSTIDTDDDDPYAELEDAWRAVLCDAGLS